MSILLINILHETLTVNGLHLLQLLMAAFLGILFLQSGLDKIFDYKGNLAYLTEHFKNSPLSHFIGFLLPVITLLEVAAGLLSAAGVLALFFGNQVIAYWGNVLAAAALLALFFGQRIAKDYGGAATLVAYFMLTMFGLYIHTL